MENENINSETKLTESGETGLTMAYILSRLDEILRDTQYIRDSLSILTAIPSNSGDECGSPGDIAGKAKAEAIGSSVKSRETTNQQLIKLYEKMYDDIKPNKAAEKKRAFAGELMGSLISKLDDSGSLNDNTCEILAHKIMDIVESL